MIRGVNHIGISVPDLDQAARFYQQLMGFEHVDAFAWEKDTEESRQFDHILGIEGASGQVVIFRAGNLFLEVFQFKKPTPRNQDADRPVINHDYTHFSVDVKDIDAEYQRLKAGGMRFHCPPTWAGEGYQVAYGRDPFGNVIEIQEVTADETMSQEQLMK